MCREVYNETKAEGFLSVFAVALLAEGVDRNTVRNVEGVDLAEVALLAEGVDRNPPALRGVQGGGASPSSRRAWIEMVRVMHWEPIDTVALLAEGVDRNIYIICWL